MLVPLSQGKHAVIDDEDGPLVLRFKWSTARHKQTFYAHRNDWSTGKAKKVYLHRLIMDFPDGPVDHIDGDGLNCRRANLRVASLSLQSHNTRRAHSSAYRGVSRHSQGRWRAQITINKKYTYLGLFDNEEDAAAAYNTVAAVVYGG
jgi:hypothetical protein